jgi:hypothetical protein
MEDITHHFLRTGTLVVMLAVVSLTEFTKRLARFWYESKYKTPSKRRCKTSEGEYVAVYAGFWSRMWHELLLPSLPGVYGMLLGFVRAELLWGKMDMWSSVIFGGVLGAFSSFFAKVALKFIAQTYKVDVPLPRSMSIKPPPEA